MPLQPRRATTLALVLLAALSLTACGRKGALEPPPDSPHGRQLAEEAKAKQGQDNKMLGATPGSSVKKVPRSSPPPKTPFILDPLID